MPLPLIVILSIFAVAVAYGVLGNLVVLVLLLRLGVPLRVVWSGIPGYLYQRCLAAQPPVTAALRRFALSTDIALLVALVTGIALIALPGSI